MATPVTSRPTAVDSSPLPALGDEKPDRDARRGQATKLSTAPSEATADQQDTSDSDEEALRGEKEVEVTANTQDKPRLRPRPRPRPRPILVPRPRPQPRLQPPADGSAPDTARPLPGAPAKHGTGSTETKGDGAEKQQQGASAAASRTAGAGSETAAADAGAHDKSRLLFRRNKNGPRKGGKQKEKGALGRAYEKLIMRFFGKKKKEPVEENPYANPITPYEQARNDLHAQKVGGPVGSGGLPSNPRMNSFASNSTAPPPYQSPASSQQSPASTYQSPPSTYYSPSMASDSSRFGDQKIGTQNGYGKNRYDDNAAAVGANQARTGGYGGFGDDEASNELLGGASARYVPPQQGGSPSVQSPPNGSSSFQSPPSRYNDPSKGALLGNAQGRYNPLPPTSGQEAPAEDNEYGGYGAPRELTEEERDRQEARAINQQTREIRKAGLESVKRSKAAGYRALETAGITTTRIAEQGNRLENTERNIDTGIRLAREGEQGARTLDKVNGSWFEFGSSKSTLRKKDEQTLATYQEDKQRAEETARAAYRSERQMEDTYNNLSGNKTRLLGGKRSQANRKHTFVDHSDGDSDGEREEKDQDMADEEELSDDVEELEDIVGKLKEAAIGMGDGIGAQIQTVDRINQKTEKVDDHVRMNRERLGRIR